jgi:hypothetical protein
MEIMERMKVHSMSFTTFMVKALGAALSGQNRCVRLLDKNVG